MYALRQEELALAQLAVEREILERQQCTDVLQQRLRKIRRKLGARPGAGDVEGADDSGSDSDASRGTEDDFVAVARLTATAGGRAPAGVAAGDDGQSAAGSSANNLRGSGPPPGVAIAAHVTNPARLEAARESPRAAQRGVTPMATHATTAMGCDIKVGLGVLFHRKMATASREILGMNISCLFYRGISSGGYNPILSRVLRVQK